MSKKKHKVMEEEREIFINGKDEVCGCLKNGISKEAANTIFDDMITFASYAFNKSHAAAYAVLAYETGYLKKYYPVEFMAALMTSVMSDFKQTSRYIRNCKDMGIEILPPSVNSSFGKFTVRDGKINFGLRAIKNVGDGAIESIVKAREEKGIPKDIFEFISNVDTTQVNKKAVESLIKSGAMDDLSSNRAAMLSCFESLLESSQQEAKKNIEGQMSLFTMPGAEMEKTKGKLPDVKPFDKDIELALEKEMLGVYLSKHPLDDYVDIIKKVATVTSEDLLHAEEDAASGLNTGNIRDKMQVTICGMISGKKTQLTKSGRMMAFIDIEDLYGTCEVIVFPNVYEKCSAKLEPDQIVKCVGTLNFKEDEAPKIIAEGIDELKNVPIGSAGAVSRSNAEAGTVGNSGAESKGNAGAGPKSELAKPISDGLIKLRIPSNMDDKITLDQIKKTLERHHGNTEVLIYLPSGKAMRTSRELWVNKNEALRAQLIGLLGIENVKFE